MTVPRHTNDASHSRFYVFRHKTEIMNGTLVQTSETLHDYEGYGDDWSWKTNQFGTCYLFSQDIAGRVAEVAHREGKEKNDGFTYCVGKVFVEVDGHYQIQVF